MVFLVTCKNEEDPIENEGTRVLTTLYIDFSDTKGQLTPVVCSAEIQIIIAFIAILVTCKNEEDPIKNQGTRVLTRLHTMQNIFSNFVFMFCILICSP